jgi:hypothetical protein
MNRSQISLKDSNDECFPPPKIPLTSCHFHTCTESIPSKYSKKTFLVCRVAAQSLHPKIAHSEWQLTLVIEAEQAHSSDASPIWHQALVQQIHSPIPTPTLCITRIHQSGTKFINNRFVTQPSRWKPKSESFPSLNNHPLPVFTRHRKSHHRRQFKESRPGFSNSTRGTQHEKKKK